MTAQLILERKLELLSGYLILNILNRVHWAGLSVLIFLACNNFKYKALRLLIISVLELPVNHIGTWIQIAVLILTFSYFTNIT